MFGADLTPIERFGPEDRKRIIRGEDEIIGNTHIAQDRRMEFPQSQRFLRASPK